MGRPGGGMGRPGGGMGRPGGFPGGRPGPGFHQRFQGRFPFHRGGRSTSFEFGFPWWWGGYPWWGYGYPYTSYAAYPGYQNPATQQAYTAWQRAIEAGADPSVVQQLKARFEALLFGAGGY